MVECHPSKVDVAGSNPVSRSFLFSPGCSSMAEQRPHTLRVPIGRNPDCVCGQIRGSLKAKRSHGNPEPSLALSG